MTIEIYDMEVREVAHFNGYIIINQSYWYPESKYTEETAKKVFKQKYRPVPAGKCRAKQTP